MTSGSFLLLAGAGKLDLWQLKMGCLAHVVFLVRSYNNPQSYTPILYDHQRRLIHD